MMTTRSVAYFEKKIEFKPERMPTTKVLRFTQNPSFMEGDKKQPLLQGIVRAIRQYFQDEFEYECDREVPPIRLPRRTHSILLEEILTLIVSHQHPASEPLVVAKVLELLEKGVLEQKCNLKGNYANLCRAIVNQSSDISDWNFSDRFKEVLGMKPTMVNSTRP